MLTKILFLVGFIFLAVCITMVSFNNDTGWSFLLPAIIFLGLGAVVHDILNPKPRRLSDEASERPLRRKKRRVTSY